MELFMDIKRFFEKIKECLSDGQKSKCLTITKSF